MRKNIQIHNTKKKYVNVKINIQVKTLPMNKHQFTNNTLKQLHPHTLYAKVAFQILITVLGGILINLIFFFILLHNI